MSVRSLEKDLRERWRPTDQQVAVGVGAARAAAEAVGVDAKNVWAAVPLALANKETGWWTAEVQVVSAEGVWVGWRGVESEAPSGLASIHSAGDRAAEASLRALAGRSGVAGYATVTADGEWSVWEAPWVKEVAAR
jgi:hypothetical protein